MIVIPVKLKFFFPDQLKDKPEDFHDAAFRNSDLLMANLAFRRNKLVITRLAMSGIRLATNCRRFAVERGKTAPTVQRQNMQ